MNDTHPFGLTGFSETLICVRNIADYLHTFVNIGGWQLIYQGETDESVLAAWQLPAGTRAKEVLIGYPGELSGRIRLVQFENVRQKVIRSNDQPWETGGIFDINIRIDDMAAVAPKMTAAHWQAQSDPVRLSFGPYTVNEWVPRFSDGTRLALIERISPPLTGWPDMRHFSRVFNSTQIVKDMPRAMHFYQNILGMKPVIHSKAPENSPGPNILSLPHQLADKTVRETCMLHPAGGAEGSVELIALEGMDGRDFSQNANLPDLGIIALTFHVSALDDFYEYLAGHDADIIMSPRHLVSAPYGVRYQMAVRAPDGAWLIFSENTKT
ncbi:VOC family protein [Alteromonas sp. 1_MG-2023]|uniref:VOC family protein n=1 Tax=Alteromonas sp. 1_MG-2023 TaxID=3062669 RepID=UPI0026E34A41|nr:VOC family protein [Alteromonas sp. 1_MG-2023]MDO6475190.1 VOC family protein [Alteromonas sp. 1_MG-2023]